MAIHRNLSLRLAALCLFPLLLLCSCEETVAPDTPFVERLVVNGVLKPGEPLRVSISKTLPLDRPAVRSDGWIGDVAGAIVIEGEGGERVPLVYTGDSSIYTADVAVQPGRIYRLEAEWGSLRIGATTLVPIPVPIDSIWQISREDPYDRDNDTYTFVARFRPIGEQVYRLTYNLKNLAGGGSITTFGRSQTARRRDTLPGGFIDMAFEGFLDFPANTIDAVLFTYDAPYYDFYQTYYLDNEGDGAFSGGSDLTRWNVDGDGIGLFIGRAMTTRPVE